ncbi:MAG: c-type cytochrome [Pseudomonadota bacterium]
MKWAYCVACAAALSLLVGGLAGCSADAPPAEPAPTGPEIERALAELAVDPAEIDLAAGEASYNRYCFSCHASGVAGAPRVGDRTAWTPRAAKGLDALVAASIAGVPPGMPPMGLCMSCEEREMRDTVAWMLVQ